MPDGHTMPARPLRVISADSAALANDNGGAEIRTGMIALAVFFCGFLGFAALAPLDAAVVAPGVLVVSGNRQSVQHRDGGVIGKIAVIEGQYVRKGDVLVELN